MGLLVLHVGQLAGLLVLHVGQFAGLLVLHVGQLAGFCHLGALAKFRKATVSFLVSVRPTAWNNSASSGRFFIKFDMFEFLDNLSRQFKSP
jgi:hypothetical protein